MPLRRWSPLLCVVLVTSGACDSDDGRELRPPTSEQRAAMTTSTTTSSSVPGVPPGDVAATTTFAAGTTAQGTSSFTIQAPWVEGGAIDARFTCDGEDVSPALTWSPPPEGTVELALLVVDDDAGGFVHWALAGIPPSVQQIAEGGSVEGAIEGLTSFGETGWGGPCPPSGTHTYRFTLYALSQQAELPDRFGVADLSAYTDTSSLAVAEVTGTYTRG